MSNRLVQLLCLCDMLVMVCSIGVLVLVCILLIVGSD